MFCRKPLGMLPEVTGPYCSQTRSGAAPPEPWLSTVALDAVIEELLFGSQSTVTFLCAASYCVVSVLSPALSAAVIAPVLGGSTALMVTGELLTPLTPLLLADEPPDEQAAARRPATASAVAPGRILLRTGSVLLRTGLFVGTARFIAELTSGERGIYGDQAVRTG